MSERVRQDWNEANQRYLTAALAVVREALEGHVARSRAEHEGGSRAHGAGLEGAARRALEVAAEAMPSPAALETLATAFGLSAFERALLLLCAGVELESGFASLCAEAQGDPARAFPTFGLALAALPQSHWSAMSPAAPLRRWRMIEVGSGPALTLSPLRIDERVLHFLAGVQHLDERLAGLVEHLHEAGELVPSHRMLAERIAALWTRAVENSASLPVVQLCGDEVTDKRSIAAAAAASLGLRIALLPAQYVPAGAGELDGFVRLWSREAALVNCALLLECHEPEAGDAARAGAINRLIENLGSPLIISGVERQRAPHKPILTFDVRKPTAGEQRDLWGSALGALPFNLNGKVEALVSQFNLNLQKVHAARAEALGRQLSDEKAGRGVDFGEALWDACRTQARPRLDDLAQRIEPAATWDDIVLPELQLRTLREVAVHVRHRMTVYEAWGFATKGARGLGISALFAGVSGTGKTMAAEVLANDLRLDLYRIDLSAVVSKYIGETEKNLRRVFDAAEEGGAILLFDEADALFGKRSEVKDSHDRYANIEVSYLLQRMEAYRGLAILTTNLKSALDTAFLRRIRFLVQFPFPDAAQRAEIWRRIFPRETPTENLDAGKLALLNVAGGNIRNIALNAAFLAADDGAPVRMSHLLSAAQSEYVKLEKSLTEAEVRGWL